MAPLYLSDLVPARYRARAIGFTVAGSGAMSVVGVVAVWASEKRTDKWQYMAPLLVQVAMPASLLVLSLFLTESPVWLLNKGRQEKAYASLLTLRGGNVRLVEQEIRQANDALKMHAELQEKVNPWEIVRLEHLERTITASALFCLSQVGGQILVGTYSTVMLVQSGVSDPFKVTVIIFLLQLLGTLVGPLMLDKIGRRPVALNGFVILFVLDVVCGSLACAGLTTQPQRVAFAALAIIFAFVNAICFQSLYVFHLVSFLFFAYKV